jgi:general secretion pathway protein I
MLRLRSKHRGFSLLEILVAFSILAISLGIILKIFSTGITSAQVTGDYTIAVQIAQNLLDKTGSESPLKLGEINGSENKLYQWRVTVSPKVFISPELDLHDLPVALFDVTARVWWGGENKSDDRVVELHTLKLATKDE